MKSALLAAVLLCSGICHASAAPRVALVRIVDIYAALPETAAIKADIEKAKEEIMKNQRAAEVVKVAKEMQEIQKTLEASKDMEAEARRKLAQDFELKRQQAQTLQRDFEVFRADKQKELDRKSVARMRAALEKISVTTRRIAQERGYELVLDSTGKTNTNMPFVLYVKKPDDLTDVVVAALKDAK